MLLDVGVHHRSEVVIFTVPEQVDDEHLRERKKSNNQTGSDVSVDHDVPTRNNQSNIDVSPIKTDDILPENV